MPPDGTPHINQETDTRARSSSGHDPQRGSRHQTWLRPRTVRSEPVTTNGTPDPACTFRPAPSCETTANHAQTPARPQFHPGHRATKWPIFSLVSHCFRDLRLGRASYGDRVDDRREDTAVHSDVAVRACRSVCC